MTGTDNINDETQIGTNIVPICVSVLDDIITKIFRCRGKGLRDIDYDLPECLSSEDIKYILDKIKKMNYSVVRVVRYDHTCTKHDCLFIDWKY